MQQVRTACDKNANTSPAREYDGLYPDPPEVTHRLFVPGLACPAGWGRGLSIRAGVISAVRGTRFTWDSFYMRELILPQPVHLMLIEGASPLWMFMASRLDAIGGSSTDGPFLLVHTTAPPIYTVPYSLKDVVFGKMLERVDDAKIVDILPAMLSSISLLS